MVQDLVEHSKTQRVCSDTKACLSLLEVRNLSVLCLPFRTSCITNACQILVLEVFQDIEWPSTKMVSTRGVYSWAILQKCTMKLQHTFPSLTRYCRVAERTSPKSIPRIRLDNAYRRFWRGADRRAVAAENIEGDLVGPVRPNSIKATSRHQE